VIHPGHDNESIAGKQFGARHNHQHESHGKDHSAEEAAWPIGEVSSHHDSGKGCRTKRYEDAGHDRQHGQGQGCEGGFGHARRFDAGSNLHGLEGIYARGVGAIWLLGHADSAGFAELPASTPPCHPPSLSQGACLRKRRTHMKFKFNR
jgi:hypothetical protein